MKNILRPDRALLLLVLVLAMGSLKAQQRIPADELIVYHIEGLTSATRDGLVRELSTSTELKIVYACVPAGILAFGARDAQGRTDLETKSRALLASRSSAMRVTRTDHGLPEAEAACSQARNQ